MDKYVCDFEGVRSICSELHNVAVEISSATSEYDSSIQNGLAGWEGVAKNSFIDTFSGQIDRINKIQKQFDGYVSGIEDAVSAIEQLEGELSSLNIK